MPLQDQSNPHFLREADALRRRSLGIIGPQSSKFCHDLEQRWLLLLFSRG